MSLNIKTKQEKFPFSDLSPLRRKDSTERGRMSMESAVFFSKISLISLNLSNLPPCQVWHTAILMCAVCVCVGGHA